jgi:hypothetical protein
MPFFKYKWIFKNRWFALLWAGGICYMAVDFVGTTKGTEQTAGEDVFIPASEGPTISQEQIDQYEKAVKQL